jgi:hypothetical protein
MILSCQNLCFENALSQERLKNACAFFGENIIKRMLSFSLYLLGVNRTSIGKTMNMPVESVKSLIKALQHDGISALEDRRCKHSAFLPPSPSSPGHVAVQRNQEHVLIDLGDKRVLQIPLRNTVQVRTVLLSLLNYNLLTIKSVSDVLELTEVHTRNLAKTLETSDATGLLDKRNGQQADYRFNDEVKSELIQQYTAHAITGRSTASIAVTKDLNDRLNLGLAHRTVRHHIRKMGLQRIVHSLPVLIQDLKKNSKR